MKDKISDAPLGFPYPTHPFWDRKAFLPDAQPIRVLKVEKLGRKVILEDGSEWDIYYFDSGKPNQWIPETTQVVVREGDGHSAYHNTILEEVDYDGTWVNARRIELDM